MRTIGVDAEFFNSSEKNMSIVCLVFCESPTESRKFNTLTEDGVGSLKIYLESIKGSSILLAYAAIAEARALMSLGIDPLDFKWVDLYVEFRMLCNSNYDIQYGDYLDDTGKARFSTPPIFPPLSAEEKKKDFQDHSETPYNLINAVFKCLGKKLDSQYKEEIRNLILSKDIEAIEQNIGEILDYCENDTKYLRALDLSITKKLSEKGLIDVRADQLNRGRYAIATAYCEREGIPINMNLLDKIIEKTPEILEISKQKVNEFFPIFVPEILKPPKILKNGKKFEYKPIPAHKDMSAYQEYVDKLGIPNLPKTETGKYKSDTETLEEFGYWGGLEALWKHNKLESSLKWFNKDNKNGFFDRLGSDNRVRPYYGIFGTQTGRNAAKAKTFPLAMSSWLRAIIQPPEGEVIIASDFSQQEIYVAAILSGDKNLLDAYMSGDVYLAFAKQAGFVPQTATKKSHMTERNLCKATVLGLQFGMGKVKLNTKLRLDVGEEISMEKTEELISAHRETFSTYWKWVYEISERYIDGVPLITADGWTLFCDNPVMTSVRNFLVQANAAAITRLAIVRLTEKKVRVLCGLHDAIYALGTLSEQTSLISIVEKEMLEATKIILNEARTSIRIDSKIVNHTDLWVEEKGANDMRALAPLLGVDYV